MLAGRKSVNAQLAEIESQLRAALPPVDIRLEYLKMESADKPLLWNESRERQETIERLEALCPFARKDTISLAASTIMHINREQRRFQRLSREQAGQMRANVGSLVASESRRHRWLIPLRMCNESRAMPHLDI